MLALFPAAVASLVLMCAPYNVERTFSSVDLADAYLLTHRAECIHVAHDRPDSAHEDSALWRSSLRCKTPKVMMLVDLLYRAPRPAPRSARAVGAGSGVINCTPRPPRASRAPRAPRPAPRVRPTCPGAHLD